MDVSKQRTHCFSIKEFTKFKAKIFNKKKVPIQNRIHKQKNARSCITLRERHKVNIRSHSNPKVIKDDCICKSLLWQFIKTTRHQCKSIIMNKKLKENMHATVNKHTAKERLKNNALEHNKFTTKNTLWKYIFALQEQVVSLQAELRITKEELAICSHIKDEAVLIRQDLEHQIETLAMEVVRRDGICNKSIEVNETLGAGEDALMDIKILMAESDNKVEGCGILKEVNEALQVHVKQLLSEKREIAAWAKDSLEVANEEKRVLENKIKELQEDLEAMKSQKREDEILKLKEGIDEENRMLQEKKVVFNRKLEKFNEMQVQLTKKSEEMKELDMRMRIKKKKLLFKKQALEKEWRNAEEKKERLVQDIKDIEQEWKTIIELKTELKRILKVNTIS